MIKSCVPPSNRPKEGADFDHVTVVVFSGSRPEDTGYQIY